MPHDKNGKELHIGDLVTIACVIKEISQESTDYCNITLESVEPMYPSNRLNIIALNTKQVEKIDAKIS